MRPWARPRGPGCAPLPPPQPNDNSTADDNFRFLKRWFAAYPEFAQVPPPPSPPLPSPGQNDFYITGESYAGIYVPMLAYRCALDPAIRFKGPPPRGLPPPPSCRGIPNPSRTQSRPSI